MHLKYRFLSHAINVSLWIFFLRNLHKENKKEKVLLKVENVFSLSPKI